MNIFKLSKKPLLLLLVALALLLLPSSAFAVEAGPQWTVTAVSLPTNFAPGDETGDDSYVVDVTNTGGASNTKLVDSPRNPEGEAVPVPVTITDELPAGLQLNPAGASGENLLAAKPHNGFECVLATCTYSGVVVPGQTLVLRFPVDVSAGPGVLQNVVRVAGGGAPDAAVETSTTVSAQPAGFGISSGGATTALSSVQAGAHPDITTSIAFNTVNARGSLADAPKDTIDDLPDGFAGADLVDTPTCPESVFRKRECSIGTQIGVTTLILVNGAHTTGRATEILPVYNLPPNPGQAAKIGFVVDANVYVEGNISLRGDYGPRAVFENLDQSIDELDNVSLTLWGVPAAPIHDPLRFIPIGGSGAGSFGGPSAVARVPWFTNPTACGREPLEANFTVTSWEHPNESESPEPTKMGFGPIVGCDRLTMEPSLTAEVTTPLASSATGLNLNMTVPQTYGNPEGLATSHLKKEVVTLPEGITVNPSAGSGLGACSPQQYAEEGTQEVAGVGCPSDSKLGTIRAKSPALAEEAEGSVFLAAPYDNPFGSPEHPGGSLLALYVVARIPNRGILVKAPGEVSPSAITGQLVTTFDDLPQVPIGTLEFKFRQGATSPLVTPPACGDYEVRVELTPWSDPEGAPLTPAIPPFPIFNGFNGDGCPSGGLAPFAPGVVAGTTDNRAGSYSPLSIDITRNDGEQEITRFSSVLPAGLTANLSGVPFCSDAAIEAAKTRTGAQEETEPSCPAASQIGTTSVGAGVGTVLAQAPGKVYMAGPYHGAPFSIVAITSAKVGPFDLGTVVVREALSIDPNTAVVTVDAKASDPIPHIIDGIVVHVRDIHVQIDRPAFTLNPTSCAPSTFSATVSGSGASFTNPADEVPVTVNDPFQAVECQALKFKPTFTASTSGKTSKADGASLHVNLTYPSAPQGTQANIREVKVDLPKQLPSRLTTLQKACTAAQFNANPAGCPAASLIGTAKAVTPILPVPLEGPAYFVSHGGEAFPDLEIVLQGYGVTIVLTGNTFISHAGITSSTFKTVPDQPVTSFELTLPEGKYSALAANGNLCAVTRSVTTKKTVKEKIHGKTRKVTKRTTKQVAEALAMPTEFVAQNGAVIKGLSTPIGVTGCPKAAPAKHKQKKATKRAARHNRQRKG